MSGVWAAIVCVVLFMIVYTYVSTKVRERRSRKSREKSLPFVEDNVRPGVQYNVFLNDGRKFMDVQLVGSSTVADGQYSFAGWEGMLILKKGDGKRVFLKQSAVRYVEEL